MTTSEFVQACILKSTGKATTLTSTDTKWIKIVAIANRMLRRWERVADWNSLYDPAFENGTVTATDTFDLDDDIRKLSDTDGDTVRLVDSTDTSQYSSWVVVNAERFKNYTSGNFCTQVGRTLKFNRVFATTDPDYGRTIELPVYLYAEPLTTANSEIAVDDPEWLISMTAAEYVRNDITKQNQYPNLVGEANDLMQQMLDDNDGQFVEVYRPWSAG